MCGAIFDLIVPGFACLYSFSFIHSFMVNSWSIHSFRKFRHDKVGNSIWFTISIWFLQINYLIKDLPRRR